jgi:[protein-PII] uridylyltransferase
MARRVDLVALQPTLPAVCRDYLERERTACVKAVDAGEPGLDVSRRLTAAFDGLLSTLYPAAVAAASQARKTRPAGRVALVAVGGYARRRMALRSDLDLVFLAEKRGDGGAEAVAEAVLYTLWDMGIEVGHVVRTIPECLSLAKSDLKTATALLEMRRLAGDGALVESLADQAHRVFFGPAFAAFLALLQQETRERHARTGDSPFLLEPDLKSGRGGLRDLDVVFWATRAAHRSADLDDLPGLGILSHRELAGLRAADELLWRVRQVLHRRAGRRADRLGFEEQEELAHAFGFQDGATLGVEQFMHVYYRHARAVATTTDAVLERLVPVTARRVSHLMEPLPEAPGLVLFEDRVTVSDPSVLERQPELLVRAFRVAAIRGLGLHPHLQGAIARVIHHPGVPEALRTGAAAPEIAEDLRLLLRCGAPRALEVMHDLGVLVALLPELHHVTGRVQHDVYHVYTVDVHSLRALERLHALSRGELADDYPHVSHVAGDVAGDDVLALAVLLHDVGKGRGRDHSVVGAEMLMNVAPRLGLTAAETERAAWLVREHLTMYKIAMKRDVSDPALALDFARTVGTTDRLRDLYVLTFADLSTTGPTVMNDWKATMLAELYKRTADILEHGPGDRALVEDARRAVLAARPGDVFAAEFVASLPDRHFHLHDAAAVLRQLAASRAREGAPVRVAVFERPAELSAEIVVVCDDRPGALARIACALVAHKLDVTAARIATRAAASAGGRNNEVVDCFTVRAPEGRSALPPSALARLEADLADLLDGKVDPQALLRTRRPASSLREKAVPVAPTRVDIDDDASPSHTVVDVYTHDRPGVLYAVATALAGLGLSIDGARLGSEGSRVADAFMVSEVGGGKVQDPGRLQAIREGIGAAIAALGPVRGRST